MKKQILIILGLLICSMSFNMVEAKNSTTPEVASAIKLYKSQDYTGCYAALKEIVQTDSTNALAYYYLAMCSAQMGKKDEALANYDRVISLSSDHHLTKYATKGKTCIEIPAKCHIDEQFESLSEFDKFVQGEYKSGFSDKVRSEFEKHKIENLMREMNRKDDIAPRRFKEYKNFSSEVPTNDEIVSAIKVLQKAGLTNVLSDDNSADFSLLTGVPSKQSNIYNLINGNDSSLSPEVIQSLLTNQMSLGF